jgi:hypothetical protein
MAEQLAKLSRGNDISYSTDEQFTGKYWIDGRPVYQKTINFGALPNATQKLVAHGISNLDYTIDVWGIALNPNSASHSILTVPAPSTSTNVVTVYTTDTNVGVTTGGDRSAYTICYITIVYVKS